MKQNIRIVPVHDRSKSCDLESLYQLIAHDVNQNTNIMVFSTLSDDIDAIVYNHNVAGLAQNLDITVSFYYQKVSFCHVFGSFRGVFDTFCHEIVQKNSCGGNINLFGQIKTGNNLIWIIKTRDVTIFRMILGFPVQTNSRFVKSKTLQPVPQFMFYLFSSISQNDLFNELILPSTVELVMVLGLG